MVQALLKPADYSHLFYGSLAHIDKAKEWNMDHDALAMLKILCENGSNGFWGIGRLHKHFELQSHECVVSFLEEGRVIAKVLPYSEKFVPW